MTAQDTQNTPQTSSQQPADQAFYPPADSAQTAPAALAPQTAPQQAEPLPEPAGYVDQPAGQAPLPHEVPFQSAPLAQPDAVRAAHPAGTRPSVHRRSVQGANTARTARPRAKASVNQEGGKPANPFAKLSGLGKQKAAGDEGESSIASRSSARTSARAERPRTQADPNRTYTGKLTPRLIVQLAAPHTWAASIMPVLLAACLSIADTAAISVSTLLCLLAISILMQSAVNTINDYFDYVKGTDTMENQDDPTDAVLVYNDIDPKQARNLALGFLIAGFVLGIYIIVRAGWIPLVIALIGALIVFLYSGGRTPISYLPIGEVVSGVTMGGLITLACYQALTLEFHWGVLLYAVPTMIGIALIMFTNNTCDIEKDIQAQRKTLPVMLGRQTSVTLYRTLLVAWVACIAVLVLFGYTRGWYGLFFMLAACGPVMALFRNPFIPASRAAGMSQITSTNLVLGMAYALCLLLSAAAFPVI